MQVHEECVIIMRKYGETQKPWLSGFSVQMGTMPRCGLELSRRWMLPSVFSPHTQEQRGCESIGNILKEPLFNLYTQANSFEKVFAWRK